MHSSGHTIQGLKRDSLRRRFIIGLLVAATVIAFAGVFDNGFLSYDDPGYVTKNDHVLSGLSAGTVLWSFSTVAEANWHPLTWMSHALDCTLFGPDPRYHHAMGLLLHLLTSLLLFVVLERMTRAAWPSAFVALVFAVHPLHVESVAWAAERKDVLSALFWVLTIGAYALYRSSPSAGRYILALALFALGLMAKPMLITLPFVLVLLDYWPLGRLTFRERPTAAERKNALSLLGQSVREKLPFFALSLGSSVITYIVQRQAGAVALSDQLPLSERAGNAVVSYGEYILKSVLPVDLSFFYPHPEGTLAAWKIAAAALVIVFVTYLVWKHRAGRPYLFVGWFWFLGTLVPVIGLVQVGLQAMADRYMYIPLIGLAVMAAWGVPDLLGPSRARVAVLAATFALCALAMVAATRIQVACWKDDISLYDHALSVTENNHIAHYNLGITLLDSGRYAEALPHFREAVRLKPQEIGPRSNLARCLVELGERKEALEVYNWILQRVRPDALLHIRMGDALSKEGRAEEAISHYLAAERLDPSNMATPCKVADLYLGAALYDSASAICEKVLRTQPRYSKAHDILGIIAGKQQRNDQALQEFQEAVRCDSTNADAYNDMGILYDRTGRAAEALEMYTAAARVNPRHANAQFNLGMALAKAGRLPEAGDHWRMAVGADPRNADARVNLGRLYTLQDMPDEAARELKEALRIDPRNAVAHYNYGNLLAKQRKLAEAAREFAEAVRLDPAYDTAQKALVQVRKLLGH